MRKTPKILDFFSGIGGLSLGFQRAGFDSVGGVECWDDAAKTFDRNLAPAKTFVTDITKTSLADIERFFAVDAKDLDVVIGGPPCQGFSTVGKRDVTDPRNQLWKHYLELVKDIRPGYVLIENVEGLALMESGAICSRIVSGFSEIGYHMKWSIHRSADFGVPQLRKRVLFLGWLDGLEEPHFPAPLIGPHISVGDAIFDLPNLQPGVSKSAYAREPLTKYQASRRGKSMVLHNHESAKHPPHLVNILSYIPDGGNRTSIPDHLQPKSGFHNSYARLASDKPAVAVTSNMRKPSSARATHPNQDRGLTVREGLRLQTFDDDFVVLGSRTSQYLQVGNAVPPILAEAVAKNLLAALLSQPASKVQEIRSGAIQRVYPSVNSQLLFDSVTL